MKILLTILGRIFAILPRFATRIFCCFLGWIIVTFPTPRRRALFANIYRCFPHLRKAEIRAIARDSAVRAVEMGLFVLASPYMLEGELRSRIVISDFVKEELKKREGRDKPLLLLVPHFSMMESITLLPMLSETPLPRAGVFYRPFNNPGMEEWIRNTRQKYGINLLSRRDGITLSLGYLKDNGCIAVLFDQSAGLSGVLTMFFDRICATSEISGILAERMNPDVAVFYARRTGFWKAEIDAEYLASRTQEGVILESNAWLEKALSTDPELCRDWLWLHKRWKVGNNNPAIMFKVAHRNIQLDEYVKFRGLSEVPRKTAFLVRAPHTLDEIFEFIPVFKALHASRYDAHFTIVAAARYSDFLRALNIAENVIETPKTRKRLGELRDAYFCFHALFADTPQDDAYAKAVCADFNFAIQDKRKRKNIKHVYRATAEDSALPKHLLYEKFAREFGMDKPLDFAPLKPDIVCNEDLIAVLVGKHASLEISEWKILLREISEFLPSAKFAIIHASADAPLAAELSNIFADKTDSLINASESLSGAALKIAQCGSAIGASAILLRLANALGTSCVYFDETPFVFESKSVRLNLSADTRAEFAAFAREAATELSLIDCSN